MRKVPPIVRTRSRRTLNGLLGAVETRTADGGPAPLAHPPVFIVGAPRSGSTLLFQLMVSRFDVGYLSNRDCRLYGAPSLMRRLLGAPRPPGAFVSEHGRSPGPEAPSECGEFWYRFFRRSPQYVTLAEARPQQLRALRAAVRAFGDAAERPLVYKNLLCSLRIGPIAAALPEALFLVIRRDLVANAQSLLQARRRIRGDDAAWWSAEPPEIDRLRRLPPHEQVVEQVRGIEAQIDRDREAVGADRFHEVRYEALCGDVAGTLSAIASFARDRGLPLPIRGPVPERFQTGGDDVDEELRRRLEAYAHAG